jgi:hypothetical protein
MGIWLLKCDFCVAVKELNAQTFRYFDLRVYRKILSPLRGNSSQIS